MPNSSHVHYRLFVDINGTIISADQLRGKDEESANYEMIAETIKAQWEVDKEEMTYKDFVDTCLIPGDTNDDKIKPARLACYRNVINACKALSEEKYNEANILFQQLSVSLSEHNKVFTSFITLIDYLNNNQVNYSIILRTFGPDAPDTIKELEQRTSLRFKKYYDFSETKLSREEIITELLALPKEEHIGWRDQYAYWKAMQFSYKGAKYHSIDLKNPNDVDIFFDDNLKAKSILNVGLQGFSLDPDINPDLFQKHLQNTLLEMGLLVCVDSMKAKIDDNYFIQAFQKVQTFALEKLIAKLPLIVEQTRQEQFELTHSTVSDNKSAFFKPSVATNVKEVPERLSLYQQTYRP
ncbi:MAG: hypothetical protein H0W64_10165 [Gammaproteobacteria bacterium]|nr:hypothetical protein [Gammaproteobacteria bacterium]